MLNSSRASQCYPPCPVPTLFYEDVCMRGCREKGFWRININSSSSHTYISIARRVPELRRAPIARPRSDREKLLLRAPRRGSSDPIKSGSQSAYAASCQADCLTRQSDRDPRPQRRLTKEFAFSFRLSISVHGLLFDESQFCTCSRMSQLDSACHCLLGSSLRDSASSWFGFT